MGETKGKTYRICGLRPILEMSFSCSIYILHCLSWEQWWQCPFVPTPCVPMLQWDEGLLFSFQASVSDMLPCVLPTIWKPPRWSLELLCLREKNVFLHNGIVLAKHQLFGHVLGVLPSHIEKPCAGLTQEFDENTFDLALCHHGSSSPSRSASDVLSRKHGKHKSRSGTCILFGTKTGAITHGKPWILCHVELGSWLAHTTGCLPGWKEVGVSSLAKNRLCLRFRNPRLFEPCCPSVCLSRSYYDFDWP